jgi:hypothetical protein
MMLSKVLITLAMQMDGYLKRAFRLNEEIVSLQPPVSAFQSSPSNRLHLFFANIERETAGGIAFNRQVTSDGHFQSAMPAWQLNMYVMLAAVFGEKQYSEGLQLLSGAATFLQANNQFTLLETDTPIYIEPVNLSFSELSNLWGIYGNQYYPSLLCKLRNVIIDANEIKQIGTVVKNQNYDFK